MGPCLVLTQAPEGPGEVVNSPKWLFVFCSLLAALSMPFQLPLSLAPLKTESLIWIRPPRKDLGTSKENVDAFLKDPLKSKRSANGPETKTEGKASCVS